LISLLFSITILKNITHLSSIFGFSILSLLLIPVPSNAQQGKPECQTQTGANFTALMCLARGQAMQHDLYSLVVDKALIFTLTDDFSEDVHLKHTIPPGPVLEHPLSTAAGSNMVEITGGCVPESKDEMEVARVCNFSWGGTQIIKDVRFTF
jgi:hypothetical protein